jgi:hypothetical protein
MKWPFWCGKRQFSRDKAVLFLYNVVLYRMYLPDSPGVAMLRKVAEYLRKNDRQPHYVARRQEKELLKA